MSSTAPYFPAPKYSSGHEIECQGFWNVGVAVFYSHQGSRDAFDLCAEGDRRLIGVIDGKLDFDDIAGLKAVGADESDPQTHAGNIFDKNLLGASLGNDLLAGAGNFDHFAIKFSPFKNEEKAVATGAFYLDGLELFEEFRGIDGFLFAAIGADDRRPIFRIWVNFYGIQR
jgi:hypothetical protein